MTKRKVLLLVLALVLLVTGVVAGVLAWMVDSTESVVNTFAPSTIKIELDEADTDNSSDGGRDMANAYDMIPGAELAKDPTVTVKANSVDCWVFVKIEEENNAADFLSWAIASGWTKGDGVKIPSNVYYREVSQSDKDQTFPVLKDNKVTVKTDVTVEDMNSLTSAANYPKLSFTAYAMQVFKSNNSEFSAADAWAEASKLS